MSYYISGNLCFGSRAGSDEREVCDADSCATNSQDVCKSAVKFCCLVNKFVGTLCRLRCERITEENFLGTQWKGIEFVFSIFVSGNVKDRYSFNFQSLNFRSSYVQIPLSCQLMHKARRGEQRAHLCRFDAPIKKNQKAGTTPNPVSGTMGYIWSLSGSVLLAKRPFILGRLSAYAFLDA